MSKFEIRKPLALAAVLATSVGAVGVVTGTAGATTYGDPASPVTITSGHHVTVVGGGGFDLGQNALSTAWAGQGGRIGYIGADGGVYTADADGSHVVTVASPNGTARTHVVWSAFNYSLYWSENGQLFEAPADGSASSVGGRSLLTGTLPASLNGLSFSNPDVAADAGESVVFQTRNGAGATGVAVAAWANGAQQITEVVPVAGAASGPTADTAPTISPDGKTIVFVRADAKTGELELQSTTLGASGWSAPTQLTFPAAAPSTTKSDRTAPIFEVDGKTVAFTRTDTTASGTVAATYSLDVTKAVQPSGTTPGSNPSEQKISDVAGSVAVRTDAKGYVTRFAGADRFDTAVKASRLLWATHGDTSDGRAPAQSVTLSRSDLPADALGGAGLAAHRSGPLLLTATASLTDETAAEIQRILPGGGTVYLLGGNAAISPAVATKLTALGYHVQRVAGADRFSTAVAIANAVDPNATDVLVATGANYPDALSAGAASAAFGKTVVVLTDDKVMPASTQAYLLAKANSSSLHYLAAIGGSANKALTSAGWIGYQALVGADRFQTSFLVAHDIFGEFGAVGVATGYNWPDSLSGGAFVGFQGGPLLLVDPAVGLTPAEDALIDVNRGAANYGFVFGGTSVLPTSVDSQLAADIATATGSVKHTAVAGSKAATRPAPSTPNVAHQ